MSSFTPAYLKLPAGELERRAEEAVAQLANCDLCPTACKIDRIAGRLGTCKTSRRARVSSFFPHHGEEDPLRGSRGSGTIFFSNCNLRCRYCQNYDISQFSQGSTRDPLEIAAMMLTLQAQGCHNINFVSPTHVVAQILEALVLAARGGLRLPLVYNTGGYDSLKALRLLDGVVDIYMPDMKYADAEIARRYSLVKDYPQHNQAAVKEMYRQVGDLALDGRGIAQRGLLVRHLVLPGDLAGTAEIARFLAGEVSKDTYINIMGQYHPAHKAAAEDLGQLSRGVTVEEMAAAHGAARQAGLHRFDERRVFWRAF